MAWALSNGCAHLPYWGIATADTTTSLSDDKAPNATQTRRAGKRPQASERGGARPTAAARISVMEASTGSGPDHEADVPPEPVWAPEPMVTPKMATLPEPAAEAVPPRIPNWERSSVSVSASSPDARWEHAGETAPLHRPVHAHERQSRRTHATTTAIVLASLVAVFVAVTIVMVLLHHSANATTGATPRTAVTPSASAHLVAATKTADGVTSATRAELLALKSIPTPVTVAALINPYVSSLQQYATVLSGADVSATARTAAADALALAGQDVQFLSTINGLQPIRLGTYLEQFGKDAAQFQKALGTLEHDLSASTT